VAQALAHLWKEIDRIAQNYEGKLLTFKKWGFFKKLTAYVTEKLKAALTSVLGERIANKIAYQEPVLSRGCSWFTLSCYSLLMKKCFTRFIIDMSSHSRFGRVAVSDSLISFVRKHRRFPVISLFQSAKRAFVKTRGERKRRKEEEKGRGERKRRKEEEKGK
jgi:hypothetical protein